ncbi:hypothetical protein JCGZ_11300 [Jatropha curcas]|uniref:Uncharacterized protein n=1 Tax=Jatropha curcas TaxID=180498 RepID=A0A067KGF6_JATCU|nr:hypothetical protein JCGZ_11300 [Jatropha curcas]
MTDNFAMKYKEENRRFTGFEERTVEDKKPRDGRLERNLEAAVAVEFESDGREDEPSMALKKPSRGIRETKLCELCSAAIVTAFLLVQAALELDSEFQSILCIHLAISTGWWAS